MMYFTVVAYEAGALGDGVTSVMAMRASSG